VFNEEKHKQLEICASAVGQFKCSLFFSVCRASAYSFNTQMHSCGHCIEKVTTKNQLRGAFVRLPHDPTKPGSIKPTSIINHLINNNQAKRFPAH